MSGCEQSGVSTEKNVHIKVVKILETSEIELEKMWTEETELVIFDDSKLVIITISVENKKDDLLEVIPYPSNPFDENGFGGLLDEHDNTYWVESLMEYNSTYYSLPGNNQDYNLSMEVASNSTAMKTFVFQIPIDEVPNKLRLSYGYKTNKFTSVKQWYQTTIDL